MCCSKIADSLLVVRCVRCRLKFDLIFNSIILLVIPSYSYYVAGIFPISNFVLLIDCLGGQICLADVV